MNPVSVYLDLCSPENSLKREELFTTLRRAGIQVMPASGTFRGMENDREVISQGLRNANASVHILFPGEGALIDPSGTTLEAYQFGEAKRFMQSNPGFSMFIWQPTGTVPEGRQAAWINEVRNSITAGMFFSRAASALQLAEDIRSQMEKKAEVAFDLKETEIFFISNQLDENEANDITDLLRDIVPVENLSIVQDSDTDYSELCRQQISKSKLAVVYFKMSGDWAVPFTQQVWKKVGGATSHTPILLIGDDDPETNLSKKFSAPKVVSLIVSGELIPLEIKVQYDKTTGTA